MTVRKALAAATLFLFLIPFAGIAEERMQFTGSVVAFENKTVEGLLCREVSKDFSKFTPIDSKVTLRVKNSAGQMQSYEVATADIAKVIYSGKTYSHQSRLTDFVVVLKNGRAIEQINQSALFMAHGSIHVSSRHPITGALSFDRIGWTQVKELRLHEPFGQVRRDGHGNIFPADYAFSPFTGEPMTLHALE